jgi:5-methylcytosine-specific restriction protein A
MPRINLSKKKRVHTTKANNANHVAVYNTSAWRNLRLQYLMDNPLCEICKKNNRIKSACEVHHIDEISNYSTQELKREVGLNYNNLMALCTACHHDIHK